MLAANCTARVHERIIFLIVSISAMSTIIGLWKYPKELAGKMYVLCYLISHKIMDINQKGRVKFGVKGCIFSPRVKSSFTALKLLGLLLPQIRFPPSTLSIDDSCTLSDSRNSIPRYFNLVLSRTRHSLRLWCGDTYSSSGS